MILHTYTIGIIIVLNTCTTTVQAIKGSTTDAVYFIAKLYLNNDATYRTSTIMYPNVFFAKYPTDLLRKENITLVKLIVGMANGDFVEYYSEKESDFEVSNFGGLISILVTDKQFFVYAGNYWSVSELELIDSATRYVDFDYLAFDENGNAVKGAAKLTMFAINCQQIPNFPARYKVCFQALDFEPEPNDVGGVLLIKGTGKAYAIITDVMAGNRYFWAVVLESAESDNQLCILYKKAWEQLSLETSTENQVQQEVTEDRSKPSLKNQIRSRLTKRNC